MNDILWNSKTSEYHPCLIFVKYLENRDFSENSEVKLHRLVVHPSEGQKQFSFVLNLLQTKTMFDKILRLYSDIILNDVYIL